MLGVIVPLLIIVPLVVYAIFGIMKSHKTGKCIGCSGKCSGCSGRCGKNVLEEDRGQNSEFAR